MSTPQATVLFVDDEPRILTTMRMLFRGRYHLLFANSGSEALDILAKNDVDVIVSDQRMPEMTGIEFLRRVRDSKYPAMRILLTGYSDLKAIVASINEGEIFRFIQKPWNNERFLNTVEQAAQAAAASRAAMAATHGKKEESSHSGAGVLVMDDDPAVIAQISKVMQDDVEVRHALNFVEAIERLEQDNIGVLVSETEVNGVSVTKLLNMLKLHCPELVSVILTDRTDAERAIALINEGQIYRMIGKPIHESQCRVALKSALRHHEELKENPDLAHRYTVSKADEQSEVSDAGAVKAEIKSGLLDRIRSLRMRRQVNA